MLEAFKTQDPNGNGEADEIPMDLKTLPTTNMGDWWSSFLFLNSTGLATSFNAGPSSSGIYVKNGKVGNWMQTDNFRTVLEYLRSLTEQGLAPAGWVTKNSDKYYAELTGDGKSTATVGVYFGWDGTGAGGSVGSDIYNQYVAMPAPAAPGVSQDEVVWDGSREANEYESYKMAMSSSAKNKDACLKIIDLLYSEKYSVQQHYGSITDGYLEQNGDHEYTMTKKFQDAVTAQKTPAFQDRLAGWIPDDVTVNGDTSADSLQATDKVYEKQYANYDHEKDLMPGYVRLSAENQNTVSNLNTSIMANAIPIVANWISKGGLDDASWESFQKDLTKLNIDKITELYQDAYDEYVK